MFTRKPTDSTSALDKAIDELFHEMSIAPGNTDEYAAMADQLVKLYSLKEVDTPKRVSPDTLAIIAGNLAGILVMVSYEQKHILTSKALNFVMKLR